MRVYFVSIDSMVPMPLKLSACIGFFDGIHLGHQHLIDTLKDNYAKAMITFDPDPFDILNFPKVRKHLISFDDKVHLCESYGLDFLIVVKTSKKLLDLSPEQFVDIILKPLNIHHLTCGYDFRFGKNASGDSNTLKRLLNCDISVVEKVDYYDDKVSSTRIKNLLTETDFNLAKYLLSRPYKLPGSVIEGRKQGRLIGYPTANLVPDAGYYLPHLGVYAGYAIYKNNIYPAMINIGHNETFNYVKGISLEAHLLDFNYFCYGENIDLYFVKYIRPNFKFNSKDELIKQLNVDEKMVREIFNNVEPIIY